VENRRDAELAAFLPLLGLALLAAAHELVVRQTDAYLGPGLSTPRGLSIGLSLAGAALGTWLGQRALLAAARRAELVQRLSCALAVLCAASGPLWFWGFGASTIASGVALVVPVLAGGLAGAALGALFCGLGLAYRELGSLRFLLAPLPLLGALALALVSATMLTYAGLWRAAAAVGAVLAGLCLLLGRFAAYFSERSAPARRPAGWAMAACIASLFSAQAFVPASVLLRYPAEVVWTEGDDHELVVTSAQNTFQLFEAEQLRLTSADGYRFAELCVHPVLARHQAGGRVLLLGSAGGFLEHEVLKHHTVTELVSLSESPRPRFAASLWPSAAHGPLADHRLRERVGEPLPWLERDTTRFDTIIVALPAPASYAQGKYYTSHFFRLLEEHLAPEGALVLHATSQASLPRTHATIHHTLSHAGLVLTTYEAPLPLLGPASFIIASRKPLALEAANLPPGLRFVDARTLERVFALAPSAPAVAPLSSLDHQRAVETFHQDHSALGN
jgi:spermidine synthase